MPKISISKESTAPALDEQIVVYLDPSDINKYVNLLKKTWPKTKINVKDKKYG